MWYLLVIISQPDMKRPCSSTTLKHFATKEEAEADRDVQYEEFVSGFDDVADEEYDETHTGETDIGRWRKNLTPEEIEEKIFEYHYMNSYMDQPPFDATIGEVVLQEGKNKRVRSE